MSRFLTAGISPLTGLPLGGGVDEGGGGNTTALRSTAQGGADPILIDDVVRGLQAGAGLTIAPRTGDPTGDVLSLGVEAATLPNIAQGKVTGLADALLAARPITVPPSDGQGVQLLVPTGLATTPQGSARPAVPWAP